jgi:large subunit ribosomal protein L15
MTFNKRTKDSRQRGSGTHGWGSKKKHRGAGNRGGRGMAGSGKRADQRKPSILKIHHYFGKHGFVRKGLKEEIRCINVESLERFGKDTLNLEELGFEKLLSKGRVQKAIAVRVRYASEKAKAKIEKAGGSVTLVD